MSAGIDYGMGKTNINLQTGIRYGIISQGSLSCESLEDYEPDYGEPSCPKCGGSVVEYDHNSHEHFERYHNGCRNNACEPCEIILDSCDIIGEEPSSFNLNDSEYNSWYSPDGFGVWFAKSPYYTLTRFCSPCAPGAGDLNSPDADGVKTYCPGPDYFDDENPCPFPIYRVSDNTVVYVPTTDE